MLVPVVVHAPTAPMAAMSRQRTVLLYIGRSSIESVWDGNWLEPSCKKFTYASFEIIQRMKRIGPFHKPDMSPMGAQFHLQKWIAPGDFSNPVQHLGREKWIIDRA